MKKFLVVTMVLFITSVYLYSTDTNSALVERYNNYALKQHLTGGGLEFSYLKNIDKKPLKYSAILGANSELLNLLNQSAGARQALKGYSSDLLTGNLLYWGGIAILSAEMVLIVTEPQFMVSTNGLILYSSLTLAGGITGIIGGTFLLSAENKINDAVWNYNKDLLLNNDPVGQAKDINIQVRYSKEF